MGCNWIALFTQIAEALRHVGMAALMASVAYGAHIVQQDGMILQGLGKFWHRILPSTFWEKPFWTCPPCMCSIWGIPVWIIAGDFAWYLLPIHLIAAAGIAAYMNR